MKKNYFYFVLCLAAIILSGCAGVEARREQRRAAFEPLRPDPEFRLLPDQPHHLRNHRQSSVNSAIDAKKTTVGAGALPVVKSPEFESCGLESTSSKMAGNKFELYVIAKYGFAGKLRARALNAAQEEIGRAHSEVDIDADDATWVVFSFPDGCDPKAIKSVAVELTK
ncbi:MAG: hypothetical protein LBM70_07820 [Victivallales bacterium]|jgi:hypothetical protein|nr:hypothetical protein [Victivallales bacterium]